MRFREVTNQVHSDILKLVPRWWKDTVTGYVVSEQTKNRIEEENDDRN